MEVSSKVKVIELLDVCIIQAQGQTKGPKPYMKDTKCYNTHQSLGPLKVQ